MNALKLQRNINVVLELQGYYFRLTKFSSAYVDLMFVWSQHHHPNEYKHYNKLLKTMDTTAKV